MIFKSDNMNQIKKDRLMIIFLTFFSISVVVLTGIYLFINRFIGSGFFFGDLATYISYEGLIHIDIRIFSATPFSPFFIVILSRITGLDTFTTIYLPYITIVPLIYCYFFTSFFIKKKQHAILLALIIFLITLGKTPHFVEYSMGYFLFLVFMILILKYFFSKFKDYRYFFLALIFLITMKFYFPYEEIFSVTFLISLLIFLYFIRKSHTILKNIPIKNITNQLSIFTILSLVILFSYSPKFEDLLRLIHDNVYNIDFFAVLSNFFFQLSEGKDLVLEYGVPLRSPQIPFLLNVALTLILLISIIIIFLIFIFKLIRGHNFNKLNVKDLSLFLCMFAYYPYAIAKLSIGQHNYLLIPIYIIGPVFIYYFLKRSLELKIKNNEIKEIKRNLKFQTKNLMSRSPTMIIVIFLVLVLSHHVSYFTTETLRPIGSDDTNYALVEFLNNSNYKGSKILTDLDTFGIARVYFARAGKDSNYIAHIKYTDERYSFMIGKGNASIASDMDLILINTLTIDRPMQRGHPDWAYFKPLINQDEKLKQNKKMDIIYSSNQYDIYLPIRTN